MAGCAMEPVSVSLWRTLFDETDAKADDGQGIMDTTVNTASECAPSLMWLNGPHQQSHKNQRRLQNKRLDPSKPLTKKQCSYDDKQALLTALKTNPFALEFASDDLRDDIDVVGCAVSAAGMALKFASLNLREDPSLVLRAVSTNYHALQFVSPVVRADEGFALQVIEQNIKSICHMPEFLASLSDRAVAERAMRRTAKCFEILPEKWRDDDMFAELAIRRDALALQHASERIRSSRAFALFAVARNGEALQYVVGDHQKDPDVVARAALQTCFALKYVSAERSWPPALLELICYRVKFIQFRKRKKLDRNEINYTKWQKRMNQLRGS
eukprot:TRINITY_DN27767_c0_g1_i1.p1 TRINITY_DN27767_c0_g1~~TRINITY_DN27767_c0_g1_i1.p1  ORF type:complete len:328 (+),score=29.75 TRINITY_DN27767_c0_g1_i1:51-1034(+)